MGKGRIVAESTSPVGKGTAGLLLMNGRSPPFSGTRGLFAGRRASGAGLGAAVSCGRKGHGYAGEDDTMPPECGGSSGEGEGVLAGEEVTLIASLCPSKHALLDPLLNEK